MIRNVRKIRKENFTQFFDSVSIFGQKMAKLGVDCKIRIKLLRYFGKEFCAYCLMEKDLQLKKVHSSNYVIT